MRHIPSGHLSVIKQYPWLVVEQGKKHVKVRHPGTQDFVPIAGSPSDYRSLKNFASDVTVAESPGRLGVCRLRGVFL